MTGFSWRTTLSANILSSSPRLPVSTLPAEVAFTLLTYGVCLANLARASVIGAGHYEHEAALSEADRKQKDEKIQFAVNLLCRASGIFQHISDVVIGQWEAAVEGPSIVRPPELTREVNLGLSK
jgi:hypothetical protein